MAQPNNAVYAILIIYIFGMLLVSILAWAKNLYGGTFKFCGSCVFTGDRQSSISQNFMGAGSGLSRITWFFTMLASLFSGYSISGISNEAYTTGWNVVRWIPAGIPIYTFFLLLGPRIYALAKSRSYLTVAEFAFDRFAVSCSPLIAHLIRILILFSLQLPVFCYVITQFQSVAIEVNRYTGPDVSQQAALFTGAVILFVSNFVGGMRGVAYKDVIQGLAIFLGCLVFYIIHQSNMGGMPGVYDYVTSEAYRNISKVGWSNFNLVPKANGNPSVSSFANFVIKTAFAATMYPHLVMRLFVSHSSAGLRDGLAAMSFTFFLVQLSSMITGWVAVVYFNGKPQAQGVFASVANVVRSKGPGGEFASALLLSAAVCAMMSTADSALIAFATMWTRDFYLPYIHPRASEREQVIASEVFQFIGIAIGVGLTVYILNTTPANLSNLFSLQSVTPIQVVPAIWLGLHWKGLRGEPVLLGLIAGLAVTLGLNFDPKFNVKLAAGSDENVDGWSPCLVGLCVNLIITVSGGILLDFFPNLLPVSSDLPAYSRPLDLVKVFGHKYDKALNPYWWSGLVVLMAFVVPFFRVNDWNKKDVFVGSMASWAFTSLLISAALSFATLFAYRVLWQDYPDLPKEPSPFCVGAPKVLHGGKEADGKLPPAQAELVLPLFPDAAHAAGSAPHHANGHEKGPENGHEGGREAGHGRQEAAPAVARSEPVGAVWA